MGSVEGDRAEGVHDVEETVYVAVGRKVEKTQLQLLWTAQNFPGKKICVLHVHQPELVNSLTDVKLSQNELTDRSIKAFQEHEERKVHKLLDRYIITLALAGVQANKLLIVRDSIEKGIVEAIVQHNIRWLIMGATADRYHSRKLSEQESCKAILIREQAPVSCNICFISKGNLICTRTDGKCTFEIETAPSLLENNRYMEAKKSEKFRSESIPDGLKSLDADNMDLMHSNWSCNGIIARSKVTDFLFQEEESDQREEASEINCRLEESIVDSNSLNRKEFGEVVKRWKVDESTMEVKCKAKAEVLESLCASEVYRRKELEELLAREKKEVQIMRNQRDAMLSDLHMVQDQSSALKRQIVDYQCTVTELEEKIISAVELLISFRDKRDWLKMEHANAVREVRELRKSIKADAVFSYGTEFPTFSFAEINQATHNFDPSWKIGEGRYGTVYKGLLHNMYVAIKMLPSYGCQSQLEFQHQVEVLSRVRHPNLLTLIGSCPESRSLVYEYLNNGSLETHLARKDKTPLPWQIRISIAADICSALVFLHSSEPSIIHGNLRPSKVLLDANFVGKLGDVGISNLVSQTVNLAETKTVCNIQNEKLWYVDPEYHVTGDLTPESDIYSFGIILLQLLTSRPLPAAVRDMKCALEKENLIAVLDFSAGEWPLDEMEQLAYLTLRCCEKTWFNRSDLVSEIWSVLEALRASCTNMQPHLTSKKLRRAPSHFVCPIFQEVMKDPYIAADGFTYEADAIRGWLKSGHNTSPMTNLKLEHTDLVPNYALHHAIQEWLQLQ